MSFLLHYQRRVLFVLNFSLNFPVLSKKSSLFSRMKIETVEKGIPNTADFRLFFKSENGFISPFHDIPLYSNVQDKIFNMVVEIPRWTNAKMEINTGEALNPIKQDIKKGNLRYVANVFPHHGYIWNYGAFPQTWENPNEIDSHTGQKGDGDPIDVLEIGERIAKRGEIIQVKALGVIGLIDEGETDWKIIAINVNDPNAAKLNDIADVETHFPGYLKATTEWFKSYKIPDGKPENTLALNGEAKNREFAHKVIAETNAQWTSLIQGQVQASGVSILNTRVEGSANKVSFQDAEAELSKRTFQTGSAAPIHHSVEKSHFIQLK
uniref:Inorganic pyrophosphatase n=2 Tax=Cacopsylla melanoneura TaxID=428564 RepID=A0A8D8XS10_9HEMI